MKLSLAKWGNSAAIRVPKHVLAKLNIDSSNFDATSFDVDVEGDKMILRKRQEKTKFELLAEQSSGVRLNPEQELDWGEPTGKEIW